MAARKRSPRRQRPLLRARLVEAGLVNENEFRRIEIELPREPFPASTLHVRALLFLGMRCFFKGDLVTVEETPQHRDRKAVAAIGDQPLLDLEQRHVRAAPDQAQQIVAMRLDPAGASVAATRRRRNLARGLEPLHPAHCARYAHFKMRGRLIARQPAQDHRLNHALAKIVGKTHPRRPHSRSVNEEAEINRFGNPPRVLERYPNGLNRFFKFSDLHPSRQRRFRRVTLRLIELTEGVGEDVRREMFDRINSGSVVLEAVELRRGSVPGPFVDLTSELAHDALLAQLAPISEAQRKRFEYEELVTRFFAFMDRYEEYGTSEEGKVAEFP